MLDVIELKRVVNRLRARSLNGCSGCTLRGLAILNELIGDGSTGVSCA